MYYSYPFVISFNMIRPPYLLKDILLSLATYILLFIVKLLNKMEESNSKSQIT
jgi:hypothetical protein